MSTSTAHAPERRTVFCAGCGFVGLMAIVVGARSSRDRWVVPSEVGSYWAFAVWSLGTGLVVAADLAAFHQIGQRMVYVGVLLTLMAANSAERCTVKPSFAPLCVWPCCS